MKRRAGETLIEVLTAMTVFGIVFAGISDFMANQTLAVARAKKREEMLYSARRYMSLSRYEATSKDAVCGTEISFADTSGIVKIKKDGEEISFVLR